MHIDTVQGRPSVRVVNKHIYASLMELGFLSAVTQHCACNNPQTGERGDSTCAQTRNRRGNCARAVRKRMTLKPAGDTSRIDILKCDTRYRRTMRVEVLRSGTVSTRVTHRFQSFTFLLLFYLFFFYSLSVHVSIKFIIYPRHLAFPCGRTGDAPGRRIDILNCETVSLNNERAELQEHVRHTSFYRYIFL